MKKQITFLILVVALLAACQPALKFPENSENNKTLNTLLTLKIGENTVYLQDYILNPQEIDQITTDVDGLQIKMSADKKTAVFMVSKSMPTFADVQIWLKDVPYSVPCRKTDKIDYVFTFDPDGKKYTKVQIAGQMNDWVPAQSPDLKLNTKGLYEVTLNVSPGTYLYQMVLDGQQDHDANNPKKVDNGYGKFNSILEVAGRKDKYPHLYTDEFSSSTIVLTSENEVKGVFAYWQNYRLPSSMVKSKNGKVRLKIPVEAQLLQRSFIRVWVNNDFGVSNDILIPLEYGKVLEESAQVTREDKQAQIMYFMLVDRFMNGNSMNDHPMDRPDVNPKVDYYGGDLAGVKQKIDDGYFTSLGVNTLWISPLNQNPTEPYGFYAPMNTKFSGYHGYWPISSSKVDFRFGSNKELKNLVADAHDNNINVLLDYVAHHVHVEHPFYKQYSDLTTPLYLPDGTLNTERWNDHRLTTWFDTFMPTLNLSNPKVSQMMVDSAMFWLKEFNLDGFRHDACKHVPEQFWRMLTLKMKKANQGKNLYQIGETYGSPELIGSYLTSGMLDGQFDFNVYDVANTTFAGVGGTNLNQVQSILNASLYTYGAHNLMGYISGNHDKPRFMAYASGDLKFGEDSKAAGWQREIGVTDSTAYDKLFLMHTFNLTIPGVPVIFYGDEIGMTGANDPDCRRMMRFGGWNQREANLWNKVATLAHLRRSHPELMFGDFINIKVTNDCWIYARKYFDKESIICINNSNQPKTVTIVLPSVIERREFTAAFRNKVKVVEDKVEVHIPAFSAEVLY